MSSHLCDLDDELQKTFYFGNSVKSILQHDFIMLISIEVNIVPWLFNISCYTLHNPLEIKYFKFYFY